VKIPNSKFNDKEFSEQEYKFDDVVLYKYNCLTYKLKDGWELMKEYYSLPVGDILVMDI
jgi:hypothetical protein